MTDTSSRRGPETRSADDYEDRFFPPDATPHHVAETEAALVALGARVFGIVSGAAIRVPSAAEQLDAWARMTGTLDASGDPIGFTIEADGTGLTNSVDMAIRELAGFTPTDVSTRAEDGEDFPALMSSVDATRFMKSVVPTRAWSADGVELPASTPRRDDDAFFGVVPGTTLAFDVTFENDFVEPRVMAQVFRARLVVVGNRVTDLDDHEVVIVVPAGSGPLI